MTRLVVTSGVVLSKRGVGEANTFVAILTEQLGLVRASAKSARREKSKLRYALEPFTQARFSFVRGKLEWKLIGAQDVTRELGFASASSRAAGGRIARLLARLVQGEEVSVALYRSVADGFVLLSRAQTKEAGESVECVLVLRVLFNLGYLPKTPELAPFIADTDLSLELAAQAAERRSALIRAINESLSATGL